MQVRATSRTRTKGFTLVEVLITVSIISLLLILSVPGLQRARASSYEASAISALQVLRASFELYKTDYGFYPPMDTTFSPNFFPNIQGYLPPESYQAGLNDQMAKGYRLEAMTDTYPGQVTDAAGRVMGTHIFTIAAFPTNPELRLRTFYIEAQGTVTVDNAFNNF